MDVTLISNTRWGEKYGILRLNAGEFASKYRPGQLCMLSVHSIQNFGTVTDPLLKRPFAPFSVNAVTGEIEILYAISGRGTEILSHQTVGVVLSLSIPHGNVFKLLKSKKVALTAGGIGIAPMYCLADKLNANGCEVHIYYGGRSVADLYPPLHKMPAPYRWFITTEDGSLGSKGFATTLFGENIADYDMCYTCGPKPMMHAVQRICSSAGKPLQVSLEETMACGIGVCGGCMVNVKNEQKRCCTEGPVFNGHDVVWG